MIEHMHRLLQVFLHGPDIGRRHVRGDCLDAGPRRLQLCPERLQRIRPLAFADEYDRAAEEVQHDGHVAMSLADADLVNGDLLQVPQLHLLEAALQVSLLDVLDCVPTNAQMPGNVQNRHRPR